ncbi:MAG: IS30 family transposase [bacterium]
MKGYKHISDEERYFIYISLKEGKKQVEIAKALERHPSTISREIRAGKTYRSIIYTHYWAVYMKKYRMRCSYQKRERKITPIIGALIESGIQKYWSPEQVSGDLKKNHDIHISHETIYRYIYSDKARKDRLKPFLRQGKKLRRKKYGSGARASNIPNRVPITGRPAIVAERERLGDWECDTVIGSDRKSVLVTLVDRKTLFTLSTKIPRKTARNVSDAMIRMLKPYKEKVHTLTFDNGSEFIEHERVGKHLDAQTYFAAPYASWERGANENTNGLLRQFFPKGTDFNDVTEAEIQEAVTLLNHRPRKTRGYRTAHEIFIGKKAA